MKATFGAAALALALAGISVASAQRRSGPDAVKPRVPVLAELFTSEGCSSCPPADELLRRLVAEQPVDGIEVIGLGEHVDYWDRLGWKDPFSSSRYTERQNAYARAFHTDRIYTPQLVIDGRLEVVGSDWPAVRRALADAARRARATVHVAAGQPAEGDTASVRIAVAGVPAEAVKKGALIFVAIVEDDLATDVVRGENARKRLQHAAVTRALDAVGKIAPGATAGEFNHHIVLSSAWRRDRLRIVAFVQHPQTQAVLGAAAAPFTGKQP